MTKIIKTCFEQNATILMFILKCSAVQLGTLCFTGSLLMLVVELNVIHPDVFMDIK
jgi:uncharacterized membrane protein YgdD (TMEM256/DUF423 family)